MGWATSLSNTGTNNRLTSYIKEFRILRILCRSADLGKISKKYYRQSLVELVAQRKIKTTHRIRKTKWVVAVGAIAITGIAVMAMTVPALQWRSQLLGLQIHGKIYDLSWAELLPMLVPGSGYYLKGLVETRNPYSSIVNIHTSAGDVDRGSQMFREMCTNCHGASGAGGSAPPLDSPNMKHGDTDWWIYRAITRGVPDTAMTRQGLSKTEAWQVVAYIRTLANDNESAQHQRPAIQTEPVTSDRLLNGRGSPSDWITYSGDYDGKRYSTLDQINSNNAASLQLLWMHQTDSSDTQIEASPIVNDGIMYITVPPGTVQALDASSGELLWEFRRPVPDKLPLCCGTVNRGLAILGTTLYWGTIDAHLIALDAGTGQLVWDSIVADYTNGYTITSAPLTVKNLVLIGVSGGEFGIRGHLDAYDATTGERIWRFYTIPAPGEEGSETWSGDSWKRGGAGAWLSGSYDPALNLLYWGTGNPSPLYYGDDRLGDNLFANSVVALDVDSGRKVWHFQFTPHDLHDWAANQIPVLVDSEWNGRKRSLLLSANRNGFFYALDRVSGEFLLAKPFVRQNWAKEIDSRGRPVRNAEAIPTPEGTITWPSPHGGTNWQSPAFSPETGLFYVAAIDGGRIVYKQGNKPVYEPGEFYLGSMHQLMAGDEPFVASLKAIDPQTGRIVWQYDNPPRRLMWKTGGVLATAGNIVFSGDNFSLYALNATSGEELLRINVGGYVNAAPVTYVVDDRQQITIAAGRTFLTFGIHAPTP